MPFIVSHFQRGYGCKICSGVYKKSRDEANSALKKMGNGFFVEKILN